MAFVTRACEPARELPRALCLIELRLCAWLSSPRWSACPCNNGSWRNVVGVVVVGCDEVEHVRDGKELMALAPRHPLPEATMARRKTGFTVPARDWLTEHTTGQDLFGMRPWALYLVEAHR